MYDMKESYEKKMQVKIDLGKEWFRDLPDIFEPTFIQPALLALGASFGSTIFADKWGEFDDCPQGPELEGIYQLRKHLKTKVTSRDFMDKESSLASLEFSKYGSTLFLPGREMRKRHCDILAYDLRVPDHNVWTIHVYWESKAQYKMRFGKNVGRIMGVWKWNQKKQHKGPNPIILDFCGTAQLVRHGHRREITYCRRDPGLDIYLQMRNEVARPRFSKVKPGDKPKKLNDKYGLETIQLVEEDRKRKCEEEAAKPPRKRTRLSADFHIMQENDLY
ncbi:hypothetical protein M422DRAFT_255020 [Sphaerobolus stellatus SS14]|uniref:Uncharacterized protein n=1 Tax=Sphaerobolus stellatus (strain SS14) TaxID=990650 RepID=A0A0C9V565_SPHS4|nr:hypothetical protein M422DRAFT_255020 [Sphaerobolus stellatus SS14]